MTSVPLTPTLVQAASWRLASELLRRHPEVDIWEQHPGGGQYSVLALRSPRGLSLDLNRVGRIHVHHRQDGLPVIDEPMTWESYLTAPDPRSFVRRVEAAAGLTPVATIPPSSPRVLAFRTVAALAATSLLAEPTNISMGFYDSSEGSRPAAWWLEFRGTARGFAEPLESDPWGHPGHRFWRCERSDLQLTFEVSQGRVWSASGHHLDLPSEYQDAKRSLGALLGRLVSFGHSAPTPYSH